MGKVTVEVRSNGNDRDTGDGYEWNRTVFWKRRAKKVGNWKSTTENEKKRL